MTILKSIIIVILFELITTLFGLVELLFDADLSYYVHIIFLLQPITKLLTYSLLLIYFRYSKDNFSLDIIPTNTKKTNIIFLIILLAVGYRLFDLPFSLWKSLANTYFGTTFRITDFSNYEFNFLKLYHLFDAIIIAPIFEEIVFRYYIFGGLLKKYALNTAILTSSILFSLVHITNPRNLIPTFLFGLISSIVYYKTKKIHLSILLHFIANLLAGVTIVFAKESDELTRQIGFSGLFWFIFLVGTSVLIFGLKKITTANRGRPRLLPSEVRLPHHRTRNPLKNRTV